MILNMLWSWLKLGGVCPLGNKQVGLHLLCSTSTLYLTPSSAWVRRGFAMSQDCQQTCPQKPASVKQCWSLPVGESLSDSPGRRVAVRMNSPVQTLKWPLMCSVEHGTSRSRMEPHCWQQVSTWGEKLAMEHLRNCAGAVETFGATQSTGSWLSRTPNSSHITTLVWELGQVTCSFWASFSPTLKLGAELGYLLASFHTVFF